MKNTVILFLLLCLPLSGVSFAQPGPEFEMRGAPAKERIKAAKKKFLDERLALSEEQQKEFWPVYNTFDEEMEANHEKMKTLKKGFNVKSDAELKTDIGEFFQLKKEAVAIEEKYFEKFQQTLSLRQIAVLYQSEQEFKRWLMQQIRNRRQGGGRFDKG